MSGGEDRERQGLPRELACANELGHAEEHGEARAEDHRAVEVRPDDEQRQDEERPPADAAARRVDEEPERRRRRAAAPPSARGSSSPTGRRGPRAGRRGRSSATRRRPSARSRRRARARGGRGGCRAGSPRASRRARARRRRRPARATAGRSTSRPRPRTVTCSVCGRPCSTTSRPAISVSHVSPTTIEGAKTERSTIPTSETSRIGKGLVSRTRRSPFRGLGACAGAALARGGVSDVGRAVGVGAIRARRRRRTTGQCSPAGRRS